MGAPPPPPPPSALPSPPPPPPLRADADSTPPPRLVSKAPPPPPSPEKPKSGAVDIDWDDDDEATTVFDKAQDDPAHALLHSAPPPGGLASPRPAAGAPIGSRVPPPPPVPSKPPPPPPAPAPTRSLAPPGVSRGPLPPPPMTQPMTSSLPPPSLPDAYPMQAATGSRNMLVAFAILAFLAVGFGAYLLTQGKRGSLVVTVAGPGNKPVDGVEIFVDGAKQGQCSGSPCRVSDLKPGTHLLKVSAAGYPPTADVGVKIPSGEEAVQNVELARPSDGTGVKVTAEGRGLKLFIDDKEIGPLPQEIRDMTPGDHKVRIDGGERYEAFERTITVEPDRVTDLEPKLKVKKGLATIKLGDNADGAKVMLVNGDERRPIPRFPLAVDLEADKSYSIVAEKRGFARYEKRIDFDDGQAEKTFVIDMTPSSSGGGEAPAVAERAAPRATPVAAATARAAAPPPAAAAPAAAAPAGANATLTFTSDPPSNVIFDGRPLGKTPKSATVPPGTHTIVFVHPELGRKAKSINVPAGKKATVKVSFP